MARAKPQKAAAGQAVKRQPPPPPSKKTPELVTKVLTLIRNGVPIASSCAMTGIDKTTWYGWLRADAELKTQHDEAVAASEATLVLEIRKETSWQAKAWMLERRFPERWRKQEHITQTHQGPQVIKLTWGDEDTVKEKVTKDEPEESESTVH